MITGSQLEVLVALVLGLDAVVIAGIVVSRLAGRRSNRNTAGAVAVQDAAYAGRPAPETPEPRSEPRSALGVAPPATPAPEASAPPLAAPSSEASAPPLAEPAPETPTWLRAAMAEAPPSVAEAPPSVGEAEGAAFAELGPPPVEPDGAMFDELPGPVEAPEAPISPAAAGPAPAGLDFGPTWVDPIEMAATAAAEWRHGLRRDLARAAHRGRSAMVMHLKLDIESRPDLSIQEVAHLEGLLLDTLNTIVRSTDHVDRTGWGRFHLILSEMPEAGAVSVSERIKHVFAIDAPDAPRLLIGWAAMESEADLALALQRAAERVDDGNGTIREGDLGR